MPGATELRQQRAGIGLGRLADVAAVQQRAHAPHVALDRRRKRVLAAAERPGQHAAQPRHLDAHARRMPVVAVELRAHDLRVETAAVLGEDRRASRRGAGAWAAARRRGGPRAAPRRARAARRAVPPCRSARDLRRTTKTSSSAIGSAIASTPDSSASRPPPAGIALARRAPSAGRGRAGCGPSRSRARRPRRPARGAGRSARAGGRRARAGGRAAPPRPRARSQRRPRG